MNPYTLGKTYSKENIDVSSEKVPKHTRFQAVAGEELVFEQFYCKKTYPYIMRDIESGYISDFDFSVLTIIATFGTCCLTTRSLSELLTLTGVDFDYKMLLKCVKKLHRLNLIYIAKTRLPGKELSCLKFIALAPLGSKLMRNMNIKHSFNNQRTLTMPADEAKRLAATTQFIANYLKNLTIDSFKVRPAYLRNIDEGEIVRPLATLKINETYINVEVVRRYCDGWLDSIMEKLLRYLLVFAGRTTPRVIINGEDEEMNREIFMSIKEYAVNIAVLFTDDIAMFGEGFRSSLYTFSEDGEKLTMDPACMNFHMLKTKAPPINGIPL